MQDAEPHQAKPWVTEIDNQPLALKEILDGKNAYRPILHFSRIIRNSYNFDKYIPFDFDKERCLDLLATRGRTYPLPVR